VHEGEPVEGSFRTVFLHHTDQHIGDDGETEQCVFPLPECQQQEKTSADNDIEKGEKVAGPTVSALVRYRSICHGIVVDGPVLVRFDNF
jgi:hypothetical protein